MTETNHGDDAEAALTRRWRAMLRNHQGGSSADTVHAALSNAILERELPPGWKLSEERLAAVFGVSRTPIRVALTRLAESDLASRDDHGTFRVHPPTAEKILEVYTVRSVLEGLAAGLAARVASPLAIMELREINALMAKAAAAGDVEEAARRNLDFHAAIARASHNELLVGFVNQIHNWIRRIPSTTMSYPGRAETSIREHAELISAIEGHDAARAESLAREHMATAESIRITMLTRGA